MADNTFGNRGAWRDEPAWHALGTVFTGIHTMQEIGEIAKVDYRMHLGQLRAEDFYGLPVVVPDRFEIMREPTPDDNVWRCFGEVGKDYPVMQYSDLADIFQPLNEVYPVETVGALFHGEFRFITFNLGKFAVKGTDEADMYMMYTDHADGRHKAKLSASFVKSVCWNTVRLALSQASATVEIRHFTGFEEKLNFKVQTLAKMGQIAEYTKQLFNGLADTKLTKDDIRKALEAVYPYPDRTPVTNDSAEVREFERAISKANQSRKMAAGLQETYNEDFPELASTGWSLWNGITEYENYYNKNTAQSVVFGNGADSMQEALTTILYRKF